MLPVLLENIDMLVCMSWADIADPYVSMDITGGTGALISITSSSVVGTDIRDGENVGDTMAEKESSSPIDK